MNDKDLVDIPIEQFQKNLSNGSARIVRSPKALSFSWFPFAPDNIDKIHSDYGLEYQVENAEIENEYKEEINLILSWVRSISGQTIDGKDNFEISNEERLLRSIAMKIWDSYGVPYRLKNNGIYRIWQPTDVNVGRPIIRGIPAHQFLSLVAEKTATDRVAIQIVESRNRWFMLALIASLIIISVLLIG